MFASYLHLLIASFSLLSSVHTAEKDPGWPWTKTQYLAHSNWSSLLTPDGQEQHSVWFIFHYLNYCGYCKRAEPGWEAVAQYAQNWTKYIQIGAYDCASELVSAGDICEDEKYPQWRIYCPLTNKTQLGFDSERRTNETRPEDILIWLMEKLNGIAEQCYGPTWPIKNVIKPKTRDDLHQIIPNDIQQFQLFVSDDPLLYSLYVLNHSTTVQTEPIYRLAENNSILQNVGIWKGMRDTNGQISLQPMESNETLTPFILDRNIISHVQSIKGKNTALPAPTLSDIDSAVVWMINRDLRRGLPNQTEKVKAWINSLYTYYPGSESIKQFLHDLNEFLQNQTALSSRDFLNYINFTSTIKLPTLKFEHCNGSDPTKRGYPCTLWVLFHSMTVKQAILAEQNALPVNATPSDVVVSIREFIGHFFLCEECATHFVNMTSNAESKINSFKESVLYLWRSHNAVNERLRYENYTNDPYWPKVPFPTKEQCDACVRRTDEKGDAREFNENETYRFFKDFYTMNQSAGLHRVNFIVLFFITMIQTFL